jgi:hypothetical protein
MPRTFGDTVIHVSEIDLMIEHTEPLPHYKQALPDKIERQIGENVAEIIEPSSYSYLSLGSGIGAISKSASVDEITSAMNRILSNKNIDECIKIGTSRPWSKICDPFLELVATHNNKNV